MAQDHSEAEGIEYRAAGKAEVEALVRLRLAYIREDFGGIREHERPSLEQQLYDYFERKLGDELIAFLAKANGRIVSLALLHIIEMPANPTLPSGLKGEVLNVYTEPEYRGRGICTQLMKNLLEYGKIKGLGRIDLSATGDGYSIYRKLGFEDRSTKYQEMRYTYPKN